MKVAEIALHTCFDGTELASLEPWLASQPGIKTVAIDRTRSVAHVCYDPEITSVGTVCQLLDRHGYACDGSDRADSQCQPGHPAAGPADQIPAS